MLVAAAVALALRKGGAAPPVQAPLELKPASPPSALNRGITIGLATVAAVVFFLALFLWGWVKMG